MLSHHTRKSGNVDLSIEDSRGASALVDAVRFGRVLNVMSIEQAEAAGLTKLERRKYLRIDPDLGKPNMTERTDTVTWFKLMSVDLQNTDPDPDDNVFTRAAIISDKIGVLTTWQYPDKAARKAANKIRCTNGAICRVLDALGSKLLWRRDPQATDWVGDVIAEVIGIDIDGDQNKANRAKIAKLVEDWVIAGYLRPVMGKDELRRPRKFVAVGARPKGDPEGYPLNDDDAADLF
jgi:hypothetical protein